jgi:uncharacterized membrane protein
MRYRAHVVASVVTVAAMAALAAIALTRLPPGTQLPTHWGADGRADRFSDAGFALFMPVVLAAALSALMAALPSLEPLQQKMEASAPLYRTAWGGLLAVMAFVELMVAAPAFGFHVAGTGMLAVIGLLFVVLGNALPKSRPGFFVGIRTPWTLTDPENWIATHRYGARIMIAGGAALMALALLPLDDEARASMVIAPVLVVATTPLIYSYFLWRRAGRA